MRKILTLCLASLLLCGCASRIGHVTNLPPGVTEAQAKSYDTAVANLHKIAAVTSTLRQTVITLRGAGAFPDDQAFGTSILSIAKIDEAQLAASSYLRDAPEYFGQSQKDRIKAIFAGVVNEIQKLNTAGATGIKNADSLKQVNGLIAELAAVVNLVISLTQ